MRFPRSLTVSVAAAVIVCTSLLAPSLLGLRVFHGTDLLERYAPWAETMPDGVTVTNPLVSDTVDAVMPFKASVATRLSQGDLIPMWDSTAHGGGPLASLPHSGVLSPFSLPYWALPVDYASGVVKLIELGAAVGFCLLFLRRLGLGLPASMLGGLVYAFSGFQVAWTNWPQAHIGALIPGLFWSVERAIAVRSLRSAVPVAAVVAVMWFEGFPQVTGYALAFAGAYTVIRLGFMAGKDRPKSAGVALSGVALGTGLAAIQLVPFLRWLPTMDLASREQHPVATLARRTLATLGVPNAFGNPVDGMYYGPADYLIYGPVNWVENQAFLGIVALLLVAVAASSGRTILSKGTTLFMWGSVGLCLALIYLGGPLLSLAQQTPLFGFSHVGRLRSILLFLLAVMAAVGYETLVRLGASQRERKRLWYMLGALSVITVVVGSGLLRAYEMAAEAGHVPYFRSQVTRASLIALIAAGLLVATRKRASHALAMIALPLLIAFESVTFASSWWPQVEHEVFYPVTDAHQFLEEHLGNDRMVVTGQTMLPSTNALYELRNVTGHSFATTPWADALRTVDPEAFRLSPTYSSFAHDLEILRSPMLDRLAARYAVTDPRSPALGQREVIGPTTSMLEMTQGWQGVFPYPGGLQAIVLELVDRYTPGEEPVVLQVELLGEGGRVAATSQRRLTSTTGPGPVEIAVAAPGDIEAASLRLTLARGGPLSVATLADGSPIVAAVMATADTPTVAFAGGAVIYERPDALPRIRWAERHLVIDDPTGRMAVLSEDPPHDMVILSAPFEPAGGGGPADLEVIEDRDDRIVISVSASGSGHLVIMDAIAGAWRAAMDETPVPLVEADHAGVAVAVPAGEHVLVLEPDPPGWETGLAISGVCLAALAWILLRATGNRDGAEGSTSRSDL